MHNYKIYNVGVDWFYKELRDNSIDIGSLILFLRAICIKPLYFTCNLT